MKIILLILLINLPLALHAQENPNSNNRYVLVEMHGDTITQISRDHVNDQDPNSEVKVIVQFDAPPLARFITKGESPYEKYAGELARIDLEHERFRSDLQTIQANAIRDDDQDLKDAFSLIRFEYKTALNGMALTTRQWVVEEIKKLPYVKRVDSDKQVEAFIEDAVSIVGADQVWEDYGVTGEGVVIGIIDSGIDYMHPDLGGGFGPGYKVIGGYDFVNDNDDPMDDYGHGTHVAGIAAANGVLKGIAPGAKLMAYKVLDQTGCGFGSWVIAAIDQSILDGNDVINLSLGSESSPDSPVSVAADNAATAGVVVVAASGNFGPGYMTISSPADARKVISTGMTYKWWDEIDPFSSRGPTNKTFDIKPDLVAPGSAINSTMPDGGYAQHTGTSMAAPVVAGAAALLLEQHPGLSPDNIKSILTQTALDLEYDVWTQGAGRLDILSAFDIPDLLIEPAMLGFGLVDLEDDIWTNTKTITVSNFSEEQQDVQLSTTGELPDGLEITYAPASFLLSPGQKQQIEVGVIVDNAVLPFPENFPATYHEYITVNTGGGYAYELPVVLLKTTLLEVDFDDPFFGLFITNTRDFLHYHPPPSNQSLELMLPMLSDTYHMVSSNCRNEKTIIKEDINYPETNYLSINKADAKNHIKRKTLDKHGNNVMLNYLLETLMYPSQDLPNRRLGIMFCPNFIWDVYFSDFSDSFYYYWYGTHIADDDKSHYIFGSQIIGCDTDKEHINDPDDFTILQFKHRKVPGIDTAYVITKFSDIFYWQLRHIDQLVISNVVPSPLIYPFELDFYVAPGYKRDPGNKHFFIQYYKQAEESFEPIHENVFSTSPHVAFQDNEKPVISPWYDSQPEYYETLVGNSLELGISPPGWYGNVMLDNRGLRIDFFDHLFLLQNKDKPNTAALNYGLYRDGEIFESGNIFNFYHHRNFTGGRGYWKQGYQPDYSYVFEVSFDEYLIHSKQGKATARLSWEEVVNPPRMTSFHVLSNGQYTDVLTTGETHTIRFGVLENLTPGSTLDGVSLFYRDDPNTEWEGLTLQQEAHVYAADLPDEVPFGYISLKIEAFDASGSSLEYTVEPAFLKIPESGLITTRVRDIDYTSATTGGIVYLDEGQEVGARGVVWCTLPDPDVETHEGITVDGSGTGEFTSALTGLQPGTTYYVRAYATSNDDTVYGNQLQFTTLKQVYTITAVPNNENYGTVTGGGEYEQGQTVELVATPSEGYHFVEWTEDGEVLMDGDESAGAVYTFTAEEDRDLVANFAINTYTLLYTAGPGGSLEGETEQTVEHGADGTPVEATPDEGYHFTGWSDGQTDNPRTDTNVTADLEVEAEFSINMYTITAVPNDEDFGTVTGGGEYEQGQTVELVAIPSEGYHFVEWTGDGEVVMDGDEPTGAVYTFTAEEDRDLVANFAINTYTLLYNAGPGGSLVGEIEQVVEHGGDGTPVEATPDEGYHFTGWSDGVMDNPRTDTNVTADLEVEAEFSINIYTITAVPNKENYGTVTGGGEYEQGQTVELVATPSEGYHFVEWTEDGEVVMDGDEPASAVYTFTAEADRDLIAHFAINTYTLLYAAGDNGGLVGEIEQVVEHGSDGTPVEAIPNEGYHFTGWSDGVTDNPRTDTNITADLEVEAEFAVSSFLLSLQADPPGTGQVSGAGEYDFQEHITLTATPGEGYEFVLWTDEQNQTVSDQQTFVFIMPAYDITLTAHFILSTYAVTFIIENEHGETIPDAVVILDQTENLPGDYVFGDIEPGDYSYTVTAENYFDASGELEVIDQDITLTVVMQLDDTGITETLTPEITIFPNPVRNTLHVESNIRISQIQLLDILGQRVTTQTVGDLHHELNVSDLKDGLYFIQVFTNMGVKTFRVQVVK